MTLLLLLLYVICVCFYLTSLSINEDFSIHFLTMAEVSPCVDKQKRIEEYEKTHQLLYELMTCYLGEGY